VEKNEEYRIKIFLFSINNDTAQVSSQPLRTLRARDIASGKCAGRPT
jgi:hypothetical protein